MKKKFSLFLVIAILSVYILQPITVNAASETLGDLLDNLNALKQKKIDNENNKNQSEAEIKQKEKAIKNAETQIQKAQIEAREAQEKIEESNIKIEELNECEKVFISSNVFITSEQEKMINTFNIELIQIPEYYFAEELREVDEL